MRRSISYCLAALVILILLFGGCGKSDGDFESIRKDGLDAYTTGNYNKAINLFKQAFLISPSNRDILYDIARTFKKISLFDSSISYYKRARILYPNDREINKELLELCVSTRDSKAALQVIASLISTGDNERMYWPLLAEYNYKEKNLISAVHYYQLLINEYPDNKTNYLYLSGTLSELGQFEESNKALIAALKLFGPSMEFYSNMAINHIKLKNPVKAEEYMRLSLELNPNSIPLWVNLANLIADMDDKAKKKEALQIYKQFREELPPGFKVDSLIGVLENQLK